MKINFYVSEIDISKVTKYFDVILKSYKTACRAIKQKHKHLEMNLTFTTDAEIKKLNKSQRGIDKATDVLSFPMLEISNKKINKKNYPNDYDCVTKTINLGDIFISLDTAKKQAETFGHSLTREITFLALHGLLHCFGFDHENEKDEKVMFSLQEFVLNKCGVKRWVKTKLKL